jgi:hypothetical protein
MSRRSGSNVPEALKEDWRRWTDIIANIARRGEARRRVDARVYKVLHRRLIASCRDLAGSSGEAERAYYEGLEATVRPWLSPRVLAVADREILGLLLDRCRRVEQELGVRFGVRTVLRRASLKLLVVASSTVLFLSWAAGDLWLPLAGAVMDCSAAFRFSLGRMSDMEKLFALGVTMILVSIYYVSRTARN